VRLRPRGYRGSDPAPEARRTTEDQVTELVALLDAAELQEPIVVVAHSLGSLPAIGLVDTLGNGSPEWCSWIRGRRE